MIDELKKTTYQEFIGMMAKQMTLPPPRHFGQKLLNQFNYLTKSNEQGLFAARILLNGPEGKKWLNAWITKLIVKNKSIYLVYYDHQGQHVINIDLEHLEEMQEFKLRDGKYFVIENEVLVVKEADTKNHMEDPRRDLTNITPPKPILLKKVYPTSFRMG